MKPSKLAGPVVPIFILLGKFLWTKFDPRHLSRVLPNLIILQYWISHTLNILLRPRRNIWEEELMLAGWDWRGRRHRRRIQKIWLCSWKQQHYLWGIHSLYLFPPIVTKPIAVQVIILPRRLTTTRQLKQYDYLWSFSTDDVWKILYMSLLDSLHLADCSGKATWPWHNLSSKLHLENCHG